MPTDPMTADTVGGFRLVLDEQEIPERPEAAVRKFETEMEILPPDDKWNAMGRVLFEKMEHLDPSPEGDYGWDGLTRYEREFYCVTADAVLVAAGHGNGVQPLNPMSCGTCVWVD